MKGGEESSAVDAIHLLIREMESLEADPQACLASVGMFVAQNLQAAQTIAEELRSFRAPIGCRSLADLTDAIQLALKPSVDQPDERINSAYIGVSAVGELLRGLKSYPLNYPLLLRLCVSLGQADVRRMQVESGMWNIVADADISDRIARALREAQKSGGKERGIQMATKAQSWKREALEIAKKLDSSAKQSTRDRLATDILDRLTCESLPGHKAIEMWLKDEAEAPNGPIRSRARRKSA
ncbi:hypothetical protein [Brevundimonas sp.]|uniref:hypothetical protein n=1 Tax=Brevundimonas sp. TaxID=1871086 RepID=UPI00262B02EB|nr:hypothetical protein [Brevundimonas sp.]